MVSASTGRTDKQQAAAHGHQRPVGRPQPVGKCFPLHVLYLHSRILDSKKGRPQIELRCGLSACPNLVRYQCSTFPFPCHRRGVRHFSAILWAEIFLSTLSATSPFTFPKPLPTLRVSPAPPPAPTTAGWKGWRWLPLAAGNTAGRTNPAGTAGPCGSAFPGQCR